MCKIVFNYDIDPDFIFYFEILCEKLLMTVFECFTSKYVEGNYLVLCDVLHEVKRIKVKNVNFIEDKTQTISIFNRYLKILTCLSQDSSGFHVN